MNCNVGHRHGSDLVLLWLWWPRPVATALIWPLAWELPYAAVVSLKKEKKKKKQSYPIVTAIGKQLEKQTRHGLQSIRPEASLFCKFYCIFFFFVFLPFLGLLPQHMEVPRLGVELGL